MHGWLARAVVVTVLGALLALSSASSSQAVTLPAGFAEEALVTGLTQPTAVRFSSDGRVFVAEKSGLIKEFDSLSDTTRVCMPTCARRCMTSGIAACLASRSIRVFRRAA